MTTFIDQTYGPQTAHVPEQTMAPHEVNARFQSYLQNPTQDQSAPFQPSTYKIDPMEDDRVYAGTYVDSESGIEYHSWEEPTIHKEVDYSLNPSDNTMDRLREQFMGGTNDDVRKALGVPDYMPEDNLIGPMNDAKDGFRSVAGEMAVRKWTGDRARAEALRKMENNFEGIDDRVGGPVGYIGLHPISYVRGEDVRGKVTAYELDDRPRMTQPKSLVESTVRTAPTVVSRTEDTTDWLAHGQYGNTFGYRDVNEYPGDAEARRAPPTFMPPSIQVQLM
jgi:hypothetical protein